RLTFGSDGEFPERLDREWSNYVTAFASYYDLTPEQEKKAQTVLDQRKADMRTEFAKPEEVTKIAPYPPPLPAQMTMKDRLAYYESLQDKVAEAEAKFPTADKDVLADWKTAKANAAKWRGELKSVLDAATLKLKKNLQSDVLTSEQQQRPLMPDPVR